MQNGKNITIKCIAEKMNISPSTVSRALNGKSGVSKEVREQIVALSQEMNYQTNRIAQSLRTSKSMEIGVIIPDSSNPFFSAMLTGIDSYAREMGYTLLMINSCNSPEVERRAIETFCELHVAGLLSVPTCVKHYDHLPMPVIFLTRCDNSDSNFNYIITDDVEGGYIATQSLINSNLSDFYFLCDSTDIISSANRLAGYKSALEENGITPKQDWVFDGANTIADGYRIFKELQTMASGRYGILCHNDYVAVGVLKSALDYGIVPGRDIRLIGYDDIELISYLTPALSTVRQAKFDIGTWGAKSLISIINNGPRDKPFHIVLKPELIIRDT